MPLRKASTTSPSSSIFSSFPATFTSFRTHARPARADGAGADHLRLADRDDVGRFGALRPLARLELHLRTLGQGLEAFARDLRVVDEQVLAAFFGLDEPVALRVVEPLHGSGRHITPPLLAIDRGGQAPGVRAAE